MNQTELSTRPKNDFLTAWTIALLPAIYFVIMTIHRSVTLGRFWLYADWPSYQNEFIVLGGIYLILSAKLRHPPVEKYAKWHLRVNLFFLGILCALGSAYALARPIRLIYVLLTSR
jgi:hypothetical protein